MGSRYFAKIWVIILQLRLKLSWPASFVLYPHLYDSQQTVQTVDTLQNGFTDFLAEKAEAIVLVITEATMHIFLD